MVFAPLLGWLALSVQGKEVSSFAASWAKPLHEAVGNLGYVLIGLHAAWALYQHYMRRNNALLNMLPKRD